MNEPTTSSRPEQGSPLPTRKKLLGSLLILAVTLLFTQTAFAAVAFRAATSASTASGGVSAITATSGTFAERTNCGSVTPSIPAGSPGDLLIAQVVARRNDTTVTMAGWNTLFSDNVAGAAYQVFLFWRSATGTDPNTVSQSGTCDHLMARITRFGNVDTAQPLETQPVPTGNWAYTNAGDVDTGTQNITVANSMLVLATFVADNRNVTQDGTFTQLYDNDDGSGADAGFSLNYRAEAITGNKGPFLNMDLSGTGSTPNHGVLFAVKPAPGGPAGLTINKPAGTITGDVMVASIAATPDTVGITSPSGWTVVQDTVQTQDAGSHLATYFRVATGSEPANYTWSFSADHSGAVGGIAAFSGVDPANPIVSSDYLLENSNTRDHSAPSITASTDDMLVTVHEYQSSGTWTPPNGMIEAVDKYSETAIGTNGVSLEMNYQMLTTSGATGTRMATASNNGDEGASQSLALKPVPLNCFTDNFTGADGASPSSNWTTTSSSGTFGQPKIYSNRLRLTNANNNVATAAHLQRLFPGAGNKIIVEFDYFAYNGSGADGVALTLSDALTPPQAGAYGGSLGYAQRCGVNGFTGGWLGVGFDEYGNFRNDGECRGDGGNPTGLVPDSVSVRGSGSGTTGYLIHAESGALSPGVDQPGAIAGPGHRYRVTIDHSNGINAWVKVERNTGSGYIIIIPQYDAKAQSGQSAVPINWLLSYTGSTGDSTNIHEIDNLSVCTTQPILPLGVDHIRIEHDGGAISCIAETVVVKACANIDCSSLYTGGVVGNLTAGGNRVAFIIPSGQSQTTVNIHLPSNSALADPQTVRLGTSSVSPTPTGTVSFYCSKNLGVPDNTTACDMSVFKAGFLLDVPNLTSGTASGTVNISAVRSSDSSTCVPLFQNVTRTVALWGNYQNPASGTLQLKVNGGNIETTITPAYTSTFSLVFNNSGVASLTSVRYDDVGLMQLDARYVGSPANTPPDGGMIVLGSDTFVVKPDHFDLTGIKQTADPFRVNPAAANANENIFVRAGEQFSVTVTAKNALGATTLNYGKETTPESVKLTSAVVTGLGLTHDLTTIGGSFGTFTSGIATGTAFTWDEVGIITLTPNIGDGNYLGAGNVTGTVSGNVGRFIPDHFDTEVSAACGTFSYSGQPFPAKITARNLSGGTTQNYTNNFAKDATLSDVNGAIGGFSPAPLPYSAFIAGVADKTVLPYSVSFTFTSKLTPPATIKVRSVDTDGVSSATGTEGTNLIRSGRLVLQNAYGTEMENHRIPLLIQYYNGVSFISNPDDTICSKYSATNLTCSNLIGPVTCTDVIASGVDVSNGQHFTLSAPQKTGTLLYTLAVAPWLQYEWDGLNNDYDENPSARANFGIYRGNDRIINWREIIR